MNFFKKNELFNLLMIASLCEGIGILAVLAYDDPDAFSHVMNLPINSHSDIPMIAVAGLCILGALIIYLLAPKIKYCLEIMFDDGFNNEHAVSDVISPLNGDNISPHYPDYNENMIDGIDEEESPSPHAI